MKKLYLLIILLIPILFLGCSAGELITKNYYILEYLQHTEQDSLKQAEPIQASALVLDADVPRSYSRKQMVIRHFGPRITYSNYHLWGIDVSEILPNLLATRLNNYKIFSRAQREYWDNRPRYEILTYIHNLELNRAVNLSQARLNVTFILKESGKEQQLVKYHSNSERALHADDMDSYVQAINEMFLAESDQFIKRILIQQGKLAATELEQKEKTGLMETTQVEIYDEQTASDGKGLLLLPSLTQSENESYYRIIDRHGYEQYGRVGEAVPLMTGDYTIHYGSGKDEQQMKKENVSVIPRYKTIVEPDWGCLIVDVMDENRNFVNVRYEVFDLESGESYGSEFPAEEEVGEQEKIWMLEPGLYKVTVNNEPFNTYRDFTTVKVEKGKVRVLTIVMETDEDGNPTQMVGAGILGESFLEASSGKFKLNSAVHGNINFHSDNEADKDEQVYSLTVNGELENYLIYDYDPIHYTMRNNVEIGTSKESDTDFHLAADEFDLKNTLIYYFLEDLGLYVRFDANTHFFKEKYRSDDDFYAVKYDQNNVPSDSTLTEDFYTKSNFFPLIMKEGLGINFRILNRSKANLSLRSGLGFRQEVNNDSYFLVKTENYNGIEHRYYKELESLSTTGVEISLVGDFQLPFDLNYSINADLLIPFEKDEDYTLEMENVFNLKLLKYISLDYKLNLANQEQEDYFITSHSLFLRVTYFLR